MNELLAPLWCPQCGDIVELVEGEEGFLHYYCPDCDDYIHPVSKPPPEPAD